MHFQINKFRSNLAKGDITRMDVFVTPILGKGVRRGPQWYHLKEWWWFPRGSPLRTLLSLTILPQFASECLWRSNQQGVGHFGAKFGEEGVDRCKPNFNKIQESHGSVVCKRNCVDIFCGWVQCTNVTDWQTDNRMVTSIAIGKIAYQRRHLIIKKMTQ